MKLASRAVHPAMERPWRIATEAGTKQMVRRTSGESNAAEPMSRGAEVGSNIESIHALTLKFAPIHVDSKIVRFYESKIQCI